VTYTNVLRQLEAAAGSITAPTMTNTTAGAWNESLFAYNPATDPNNPAAGSFIGGAGLAGQDTTIDPGTISGSLTAKAWDGNQGFGGSARSRLTATFTVASATGYALSGSWSALDPNVVTTLSSSITLTGPGGTVFGQGYSTGSPLTTSGTLGGAGTLAPGSYTLTIDVQNAFQNLSGNLGSRQSSLSFTLAVPSPGAVGVLGVVGLAAARRRRR
jgi:MYXO-CTERM domain-containing protein